MYGPGRRAGEGLRWRAEPWKDVEPACRLTMEWGYGAMNRTRKLTHIAIFVALALVLHVTESFIPVPFIVPGAKLGLANIVTLVVIVLFGMYDALVVVAIRTFLGSLLSGALTSFAFSVVGGILATLVMSLAHKRFKNVFGLVGVSVLGAVSHNIGQLLVAGVVVGTMGVYSYLPMLLVAGVGTGYFVGVAAGFILGFLPRVEVVAAARWSSQRSQQRHGATQQHTAGAP